VGPPPKCAACTMEPAIDGAFWPVPLTTAHLLWECPRFHEIRNPYSSSSSWFAGGLLVAGVVREWTIPAFLRWAKSEIGLVRQIEVGLKMTMIMQHRTWQVLQMRLTPQLSSLAPMGSMLGGQCAQHCRYNSLSLLRICRLWLWSSFGF
jgi:hypothetical protein